MGEAASFHPLYAQKSSPRFPQTPPSFPKFRTQALRNCSDSNMTKSEHCAGQNLRGDCVEKSEARKEVRRGGGGSFRGGRRLRLCGGAARARALRANAAALPVMCCPRACERRAPAIGRHSCRVAALVRRVVSAPRFQRVSKHPGACQPSPAVVAEWLRPAPAGSPGAGNLAQAPGDDVAVSSGPKACGAGLGGRARSGGRTAGRRHRGGAECLLRPRYAAVAAAHVSRHLVVPE